MYSIAKKTDEQYDRFGGFPSLKREKLKKIVVGLGVFIVPSGRPSTMQRYNMRLSGG
jgi:hypothetical protein